MPKYLRSLLLLEAALLTIAALSMPFIESGAWRFVVPVLNVGLIALCFAFYRRVRHADELLSMYCIIGVVFAGIYFLATIPAGAFAATLGNTLLILETGVLVALHRLLRSEDTSQWFRSKTTAR